MSTINAREDTNTNIEIHKKCVDRDIKIKKINKTETIICNDGGILIISYVDLEEKDNILGHNIPFKSDIPVIIPQPFPKRGVGISMEQINAGKDTMEDLQNRGWTKNQQLYQALYRDFSKDPDIDFYNTTFIFILDPLCYDRKQSHKRENYDRICRVGNYTVAKDILLCINVLFAYKLNSFEKIDIQQPLKTKGGSQNNITKFQLPLGKAGVQSWDRVRQLNIIDIKKLSDNFLYYRSDEDFDKGKDRKCSEIYRISGNKKNWSIRNMDIGFYKDVTSSTRKKEVYKYKYVDLDTGIEFIDFDNLGQVSDDIILKNHLSSKYNALEIDNLVYISLNTGLIIDGKIIISKYTSQERIRELELRKQKKMFLLYYTDNPKDIIFGTTREKKAGEYLSSITGNKDTSMTKYIRNAINTKEFYFKINQGKLKDREIGIIVIYFENWKKEDVDLYAEEEDKIYYYKHCIIRLW